MSHSSLRRRTRLLLAGLVLFSLFFGGVVLFKSVFLKRRQGDLGCFVRAGWAIRQGGGPLYQVLDDNQWHYNYPPLFAILMTPLADPPLMDLSLTAVAVLGLNATPGGAGPLLAAGAAAASPAPLYPSGPYYLPYPVSVVIFYLVGLTLLVVAVHLLAGLLESFSPLPADPKAAWRLYWRWRLWPVVICLPAVGLSLVRGQVQTLLLLLLTGLTLGLVRGKRLTAGLCIAGAVCLKLFPAFLVVLPLWRRDLRCLFGLALGVVLGLAVIPALVLGPEMTARVYRDYADVLILPGLGVGGSSSRSEELTEVGSTQSQAFQVILAKTVHLRDAKLPAQPAAWMKVAHWSMVAAMTLATLLFIGRRRTDGLSLTAGVGMLALVMVLLSPVCHLHYFTVGLPVVMALLARFDLEGSRVKTLALALLFTAITTAWSIPMIPGWGILRNVGVPMYGALALWLTGLVALWAHRPESAVLCEDVPPRLAA